MKLSARKILYIAFFASLVSALVSTVFLFKSLAGNGATKPSAILEKLNGHTQKMPDKTQFNVLLLGYGGANHSGGGLSDAIILANINTVTKNINFIAIPRDIWVDNFKINSAYTTNAGVAKSAVEKVTGIPVDFYAAIDFSRFIRAVDALGGLTVNVPVSFDDHFYPIAGLENELCGFTPEKMEEVHRLFSGFELEKQFTCRYEQLYFDAGPQKMDGETALKFIRSRHGNAHGGDFARGVRQQAVLVAARNKLISLEALTKIDDFFAEFSKLVVSDITEEDVVELLSHTGNPGNYTTSNINISTDNYLRDSVSADGQYILIPKAGNGDWQAVHEFVKNEIK